MGVVHFPDNHFTDNQLQEKKDNFEMMLVNICR